jgi:hypothetical protein
MEASNELIFTVVKRVLETSRIRFASIVVRGRLIIARVRRDGVDLCVTVQLQPELAFAHTLEVTKGDEVSEMFGCLLRGLLQKDEVRIRGTLALAA